MTPGPATSRLDSEKLRTFVQRAWDERIVPTLTEYIRIPCKSPSFDPQWREHGHLDRAVGLVEECGSYDLPHYVDALAARLGTPSLVVCLDSGCGNYDQLWGTTSLRGIVNGELTVEVLREGVHSGAASGIVPSSFRIARRLLSRIEDEATGEIIGEFHGEIPKGRLDEARVVAGLVGHDVHGKFPFV